MCIKFTKLASDNEESKVCSEGERVELGKRPVRKWQRRWVLQPNVFDLNRGEIWVQKWVRAEKAEQDQTKLDAIAKEIEAKEAAEEAARIQAEA